MTTSRTAFNNTWLTEMLAGIGQIQLYDALEYTLRDLIAHRATIIQLQDNLFKIAGVQTIYYWFQHGSDFEIISAFDVRPQGLVVSGIARNPGCKKIHHASDLYSRVLRDTDRSIRIVSDTQLSDEGLLLWKRLVSMGYNVSVYDKASPGKSFNTFTSPDELDQFYKYDDRDFKRYQFVLSESRSLMETRAFFNTRRMRELCGFDLED